MTKDPDEIPDIKSRLFALRQEHRLLDEEITRLAEGPYVNELQLKRMKQHKLMLKDMIVRLEDEMIPDLDA